MSPTLAQRGFKCIEHDTHAGDGLRASLWWQSLVLVRQLGPPLIQVNQRHSDVLSWVRKAELHRRGRVDCSVPELERDLRSIGLGHHHPLDQPTGLRVER